MLACSGLKYGPDARAACRSRVEAVMLALLPAANTDRIGVRPA